MNSAIDHGIAYVSEDRKEYGLILIDSVKRNLSLSNLTKISQKGVLNDNKEVNEAEKLKKSMNIKAPSIDQKTVNLSGGTNKKLYWENGCLQIQIS